MHYLFVSTLACLLASTTLHAAEKAAPSIPAKVQADILKRHPEAQELQASSETHFGVKLLEVGFKLASGEPMLELFTAQGHLFTNELRIEDLKEIPDVVMDSIKKAFEKFQFKHAELVSNPNGVGEEYEIYLNADGADWKVSINEKGAVAEKQRL